MNDFIINRLFGALVWPLKVVSCLPFFNCDDCGDSIIHVLVTLHNKMCQPIPYVKALKNNVIDNCKALLIKQRIITERFSWLLKVSSTEKMISTKFFIFLLMVILDCNNAVLARSLNPTRFLVVFMKPTWNRSLLIMIPKILVEKSLMLRLRRYLRTWRNWLA